MGFFLYLCIELKITQQPDTLVRWFKNSLKSSCEIEKLLVSLCIQIKTNTIMKVDRSNQTLPKEVNPFDGINSNIELMFEPIAEWTSCGNNYQRSKTMYKNVEIIHDVINHWNILKRPSDNFSVGLIIPIDTVLQNDGKVVEYYCPDGFGCPDFKTLKDALEFIDNNPELANNEVMLN